MMQFRGTHVAWWIVCAVASLSACSGGVIGGKCGIGFEECGHQCVPTGTCTLNDASGDTMNFDGTNLDTHDGDGFAPSDSATGDSSQGDGQNGDGQNGDSLADGGGDSGTVDGEGGACYPPYNLVDSCGSCGFACQPGNVCRAFPSDVGPDGGPGWACASSCGSDTNCNGTCTDLNADPNNCGQCGIVCASGICAAGICSDRKPGYVVVIGHDYSTPPGSQPTTLLINAALVSTRAKTRIIGFEYDANPSSISIVKGILQSEATRFPYTYKAVTSWAALAPLLGNSTDVVLIYDQWNSNSAEVQTQAQQSAGNFDEYVAQGGTIVVLASGSHAGGTQSDMATLLTTGDLLDVTQASTDDLAAQSMEVVDFGDSLANNLTGIYSAPSFTVSFNVTDTRKYSVVVENAIDQTAVVIHRAVFGP